MKDISLKARFESIKKLGEGWFDAYYKEEGFDKLGISKKDVIFNEIHHCNRLYIEAKLNGFINRMAFHEYQKNDLIQYAKENNIDLGDILEIDRNDNKVNKDKTETPDIDYYLKSKLSELVKEKYFERELDLKNFIYRVFFKNTKVPKPSINKVSRVKIVRIFYHFLDKHNKEDILIKREDFKKSILANIENSHLIEKTIKDNWRA